MATIAIMLLTLWHQLNVLLNQFVQQVHQDNPFVHQALFIMKVVTFAKNVQLEIIVELA